MDRGWREGRGEDIEQARREFMHLAEHLGIPPEQVEGLLMEHAPRRPMSRQGPPMGERPDGPPGGQPGGQPGARPGGGDDRIRALEERLERLERLLKEVLEMSGKQAPSESGRHARVPATRHRRDPKT